MLAEARTAYETLREEFRVTGAVLTDGFYWRIQPLLAVQQLAFIGCISLWIGPWLRDVGGIVDKDDQKLGPQEARGALAAKAAQIEERTVPLLARLGIC